MDPTAGPYVFEKAKPLTSPRISCYSTVPKSTALTRPSVTELQLTTGIPHERVISEIKRL